MRRIVWARLIGLAVLSAAVPGLAAQNNGEQPRSLEFAAPASTDPLLARADAEARAVLNSRGYAIIPAAPFRIELALSRRPNDVGLKSEARGTAVQVATTPGKRRVDLCRDTIYRLVIAQFETRTGAVNYRGSAELRRCAVPSDKDIAAMVMQALAGLR